MEDRKMKVLVISDSKYTVPVIRGELEEMRKSPFVLENVQNSSMGLKSVLEKKFDVTILDTSLLSSQGIEDLQKIYSQTPVVLLDLSLPGYQDSDTVFLRVHRKMPEIPIVRIIDFGQRNGEIHTLVHSMWYAIERHKFLIEVYTKSLIDELTGLHNRRGFMILAEQQIKLANRNKATLYLLYADIDRLKKINDTLGHRVGDQALVETADVLRKTFRKSDILARIGGDEFTVIPIEAKRTDVIMDKLNKNLKIANSKANRTYELSISVGLAAYSPDIPITLEDLLARADMLMYENKKNRQTAEIQEKPAGTVVRR